MPSAEKYGHVYDTTHEFGHMVQISLDREWIKANPAELEKILTRQRKANTLSAGLKVSKSWSDKLAMRHFKEIEQIFNSENKGEKIFDYISDYGKTSYEEAFAEMFANSQCGDVNKAGEAMAKYLDKVIQVED